MIRLGRSLSWFSIGTLPPLMIVMSVPPLFEWSRTVPALSLSLDALGATVAFATLIPWPMAIWHWRRRYPPHPNWVAWGFAIFFGVFVGAWGYWLIATKHYEAVDAEAEVGESASSPGGAP